MSGASFVLSAGTYRLEVVGDLDLRTAPGLIEAALTPRRARDLVVDLTGVTFLDAAGVGGLVTVWSGTAATGRRLHLTGVTPSIVRVLRLARADFLLDSQLPETRVLDQLTAAIVGAVRAAPRTVRLRAARHELAATR